MGRVCVAVALVGVVAACVVSCGGGGRYSSPKATYETMWAAAKAGNKDAVVECFSDECRRKIAEIEKSSVDAPEEMKSGDNEGVADKVIADARKARIEVGAEKIEGDKATLEVTTDGEKEAVQFIKEGAAWKIHIPQIASLDVEGLMKEAAKAVKTLPKETIESVTKGLKDLK